MKVLIACEFSGIVRDAFIAKGHSKWMAASYGNGHARSKTFPGIAQAMAEQWG